MVHGLGLPRGRAAEGVEDLDVVREGNLREVECADRYQEAEERLTAERLLLGGGNGDVLQPGVKDEEGECGKDEAQDGGRTCERRALCEASRVGQSQGLGPEELEVFEGPVLGVRPILRIRSRVHHFSLLINDYN